MRAVYGGDASDNLSVSATLTETVHQGTTPATATLTSSPNPSVLGGPVTLSVTVSPADATGSVGFYKVGVLLGTAPLAGGQAQLSLATLPAGSNVLMAVYNGDLTYAVTTSNAVTQIVAAAPAGVALTSSANPSIIGQGVTLTAAISPATATGTVQFLDGATALGTATITGGSATLSLSTLSVGAHSLAAVYSGDANNVGNTSSVLTQTVNKAASSVALASSANPSTVGQSITLTATVTPGTAAGTVQFLDGATALGTAAITGSSATLALSTLPVGTHSLTAVYSGDANNAASTSAVLTQTINKVASSVVLSTPANPAPGGLMIVLSASVTPSTATGTVQFLDGTTPLGTLTIYDGVASQQFFPLSTGAHSITAIYSGDANDAASTSAVLALTVDKIATTVQLASTLNPSAFGQSVTLFAACSPTTVTGTIQFLDGTTLLGSMPPNSGSGYVTLTNLSVGAHAITAVYSGDADHAAVTSAVMMQTVTKAPTSVALTTSANPSTSGQSIALTATVTPSTAAGTVQFLDGATALGTAAITGGSATLALSTLPVGTHSLTAAYSGDANDAAGTSAVLTQTVNKVASSVALTSSANPSTAGQSVTLSAAVTPSTATGTVQFLDGSAVLGTVTVTGGSATLALSTLPVGTHSLTAVYSGDANDAASTSAVLTQTINKVASSVALTSSANPSTVGQSVTLSAAVTPSTATGTVQFLDGSAVLGTVAISGGSAAMSVSTLSVGTHSLTAVYSGDANDAASTSAVLTQTITKGASSVALTSSANPSTVGQSVTLSAAVTPSTATGTVQFMDGSTALGTVAISGGSAAMSVSTLSVGTHSVTAVYSGDANDAGSTSAVLTETVQQAATTTTLTSSVDRTWVGQNIPLAVTVTPPAATGTVNLMKGSTILATSTVTNGAATLNISTLPAGPNTLYARYTGNASYLPSNSLTLVQTVVIPTSTVLTTTPNPSVYGATVTLTLTATPTSATGPVQFNNGAAILGTANLVNGQAKLLVANLPVGAASLIAYYNGDDTHGGSTSLIVTQTVNKAPATVSLASSKNPSVSGQSVTFTAAVSPSSATGTVQFLDGSTVLGTVTASGGVAALSLSSLSVGTHSIKAAYSGDAQYLAGTSPILTQTVSPPAQACHVGYTVTSQWNNGFGTAVTIQNTGSAPVNGWNLTWTWPGNQKITQSWNSTYSQSGANAKVTNASYNAAIASGATLTGIGFNASYSGSNTAPSAFYLNGTLCK
jgi:hypothetical protein